MSLTTANTLVSLLQLRASTQAEEDAFIFLRDGDADVVTMTYLALHERSCGIAGYLQKHYQPGDRVLLMYPSGLDFIAAFFGCLYAGMIAVPVQTPRAHRGFAQLEAIIDNAKPKVVLTDSDMLQFIANNVPSLTVLASNTLDSKDNWRQPSINEQTLAFLQYTSGSTGSPKGVMVSHGNVMHNQSIMKTAFKHDHTTIVVGWLPFYHDMGLIGNMLQPVYLGRPCIFMQPMAFIQNPFLWLQAISRYQATTSGGPSFAYELCLRKITHQQRQMLDLSSWRTAFNGAEPVRAEVLNQFADYFATSQFRSSSFLPCYGMAEATLFITGSNSTNRPVVYSVSQQSLANNKLEFRSPSASGISIVGCGQSSSDQIVKIVSPTTLGLCGSGQVGEIWVSGPSVAQGYWNNPEATLSDFKAQITGLEDKYFLRTGDLGFFHDNELFIAGRLKDLIIIRGRNYYPQDIEKCVEKSHEALKPTCCAAFAIEVNGEEKLVIVQEVEREYIRKLNVTEVMMAIRQAVSDLFHLNIHALVLLKTGQVPKTSSGKVKRRACKQKYLQQSFEIVAASDSEFSVESRVVDMQHPAVTNDLQRIQNYFVELAGQLLTLDTKHIDINSPLTHYGIDSILATEFQSQISSQLHINWPFSRFLQGESLAQLASAAMVETPQFLFKSDLSGQTEFPLSPTQEGMYFLYQFAPDNPVYNLYFAARIQQPLNVQTWDKAWNALVARQQVLRTTYHHDHGRSFQRVHDLLQHPLHSLESLRCQTPDLEQLLLAEALAPFALDKAPPFRIKLYETGQDEYIFLFSAHHIACDLSAILLLMREFNMLYQQDSPELKPLSFHYSDYVSQQHDYTKGMHYWQQKLGGDLPILNLPLDHPRPPVQTFNGAAQTFKLKPALLAQLQTLAKQQDMTLYMVLMAAYQLLLHRYTHQDDILVGSPVAGRNHPNTQALVGCFINTIVLRATFSQNLTFKDLLANTRQSVLEAFEHQEFPFHQLVAQLQTHRDNRLAPVFQTLFVLQNSRFADEAVSFLFNQQGTLELGGISFQTLPLEKRTALYDLTLVLAVAPDGLCGSFEYNKDLFDEETIERFIGHFETLLEALVLYPSQPVALIPLLPKEEQDLLAAFNHTAVKHNSDTHWLSQFMHHAQTNPQAVAAVCAGKGITYQELNEQSNQLAHYLQAQGVSANVLVGVLLDRSMQMLIALLGILKAGGAYLPLDPTYPSERLQYMIDSAQLTLVVTDSNNHHELKNDRVRLLQLDELAGLISEQSPQDVQHIPSANHLAYVIYTSGSTGKPKGVLIQHRSLSNFLTAMQKLLTLQPGDKWLAVTTISFDISILELFLPLMIGASVVIAESKATFNADELIGLIQDEGITIMQATPSTWQMLCTGGWCGNNHFKALVGGEVLPAVLAQKLRQGGCRVWNLYGPTENTIWTTAHEVTDIKQDKLGNLVSIPIGKPLDNIQVYILDSYFNLTPIGVAGELYIGGVGVSEGYLHQPELTRLKFINSPFNPQERLYATGDLASYLPDGTIKYLARIDNQVKFRGYRIELEEIENLLLEHELISDCAVVLQHDAQILAAYVVSKEASNEAALQVYLRQKLPNYMVPSLIEFLPSLPRTNNNKIDRKALAASFKIRDNRSADYVAPRTEAEKLLATIWCLSLKLARVSVHDNFFYLGGHSLLAQQISNQLIQQHDIHLPLSIFFESQTLEHLALEVEKQQQKIKNRSSLVDKIKNLSPEEVKCMLEAKRSSIKNM